MAEDSDKPVIDLEKLKSRPRHRVRSEKFVSLYSNSLNVEVSFNDFKLFFGRILEATPEKLVTEDGVEIIMGPEETLAVADVLNKQLKIYEDTFGPIRKPPGA